MKTSIQAAAKFMLFCLCFAFAIQSPAATVTQVSEGKINQKTSIIVSLEDADKVIHFPVTKDKTEIKTNWILSADHSFQYFPVNNYGIGEYEVTFTGADLDEDLEKTETITVYEQAPAIRVLGSGPFLNASGDRAIPVESVNTTGATVSVYRVDNAPELFSEYYYTNRLNTWSAQRLRKNFEHQTDLSFKLPASLPNEGKISNLVLPDELGSGWYVLTIKPSNSFNDPSLYHVLLSDIGLQAKLFGNQASVQAVDLGSDTPLASGRVSVISKDGVRTTTELKDGFARFDYPERNSTDVFMVESQGRVAILPMKEIPLDLSDFAVSGQRQQEPGAFIFSNRDLFKPGETVSANILLRKASGEMPAEKSVYVEVIKPDGKVALSQMVEETVAGLFKLDFAIPPSASLGKWSLVVKANRSATAGFGQFFFNVAEFVPERMDLEVDVPATIAAGQALDGKAFGRYLFGQKASGNRFVVASSLSSIRHFSGKFKDFYVGKNHHIGYSARPETQDLKLDEEGHISFKLDAIKPEALDGPAKLTLTNQLFEEGGATTTRVKRLVVSNGKSVVGIRPASEEFGYYENANFSLVLLDGAGSKALPGEINLRVERNRGGYYWIHSESSGWRLKRDDKWRIIESKPVALNENVQELSIPVEWGDYRIIATSPDGQESIYPFYVGWRDGADQIPVKPDQLAVRLDKESYNSGDTISVEVNSPVNGLASFELVGDKSYVQTYQRIEGKTTVQIQIPADLARHDLYLIATMVNSENAFARRLLAVTPVKLYRDNRRLSVKTETPEKFIPLMTQTVTVKVDSQQPLENPYVVLTIADKGITNLSRYKVPSVFDWFYGQKRLSADIIDLYSRQFESRPSSFIRHRYGGDEEGNGNRALNDLVESKSFNQVFAPVKVDQNGEARIEVSVPDYNGEVQVVATAFDGNRFGHQAGDVTVSAPVVTELSVPRFFATGSQSQVMMEVSNQTDENQTIELSLSALGGITLSGDTSFTAELEPGKKTKMSVDVIAGNAVDMASLSLNVQSDVLNVNRSWRVPVRSPSPFVTKKDARVLAPGDVVRVTPAQWDGVLPMGQGTSSLSFSRTPQIEPMAFVRDLFRYPYGCVEQTTSKAFPWLLNEDSLLPLKEAAAGEKSEKEILMQTISRLENYQNSYGGYGLWGSASTERAWLTAYVADFFLATNQRYPGLVNEDTVKRTVNRVKYHLLNSSDTDDKAYAGYVLASHGLLSFAEARHNLKSLKTKDSLTAAYLGATFYLLGDREHSLVRFVRSKLTLKYYAQPQSDNYYDSAMSSSAKVISLVSELEKVGPIDPELETLRTLHAEAILAKVKERRYFSTQEKYALAMAGFHLQALNTQSAEVTHNKEKVVISEPVPMLPGDEFINTSEHTLYVTKSVEGYADPALLKSSIESEQVKRTYLNREGTEVDLAKVRTGDIIIARVTFKLQQNVEQGMLIEHLPAGMVLENPDYTGSAELLKSLDFASSESEMTEYRNDRFVTAGSYSAGAEYTYYYVMRAETPGTSVVPHIFIEDMYSPEHFVYEPPGTAAKLTIKR